ncbi:ER membrane protein complex subunit 7 homolog [Cylas formicarius]|uniref:ER membrane protein complex subunit 7 homolog n=1 Tax=Cylas formicarius TaxID=197179 RepID=UPI002958C8C4|nr:ER membrane protein complex subunit 7 homolog [Cylas formicarius]
MEMKFNHSLCFDKIRLLEMVLVKLFACLSLLLLANADNSIEDDGESGRYTIEGRVFPLSDQVSQSNWQATTRIHVNGGEYIGFVKKDGSFVVHNVPSGSYVIEVLNPDLMFEPVRVEINSKGKFRARKVNYIQTSQVVQVPYPLKMKALGKTRYFQVREQWRITDFLFNPMVMMMVLPLVLIMILPKMMNDPETKKEMEQIQSMTKFEMPEMSDMVSNYLAGNNAGASASQTQSNKKQLKTRRRVVAS